MILRKITNEIKNWYEESTSSLLIDGARNVGKTTAIEDFLKSNNLNFVQINLLDNKLALEAFNTSNDCEQLLIRLSALSNNIIPNNTIFFIDEIQEADDAITPIKFLTQAKEYRFIFSGSLLGIKMKNIQSIPVGYLKILTMYPLDFEEFITALSVSKNTIAYLKDCFKKEKKIDDIIHKQMMNIFNLYLVVGGMPEAVNNFINTKNINFVNEALEKIDKSYVKDIAKYDYEEKLLIEDIYQLIPSELNSQNKRFIIKSLNEKARFYKYDTSFVWLKDSGVGLFTYNVDNPIYPLLASKERTLFKLFLCDVGLLSFKLYKGKQICILNNNDCLNNGAIYEAFVAQELTAHGLDLFYNNDKKRGEIDFLIENDTNEIIPIEVKSGKKYKRHSALTNLLDKKYNIKSGIVLTNNNLQRDNNILYMPIYLLMFFVAKKKIKNPIINLDIGNLI